MTENKYKKYDILEYQPIEEDLNFWIKGNFMHIPRPKECANLLKPHLGEVEEFNSIGGMSIKWLTENCPFKSAWWHINDPRFKKVGERQVVLFNASVTPILNN